MDYLKNITDKQSFFDSVKQSMDNVAMSKLEDMKKEIANSVLKAGE